MLELITLSFSFNVGGMWPFFFKISTKSMRWLSLGKQIHQIEFTRNLKINYQSMHSMSLSQNVINTTIITKTFAVMHRTRLF